jgi:predicted GIY-YIG superfamily endonuclease/proteasome lid subunit RPN8/RPN11
MPFWAYMLHCRGGLFYTGHTDDLERRIGEHQSGLLKGFTSQYLPVELVWAQEFFDRFEALEAEHRIKGWSRTKKLALIRGDWESISRLAKTKSGPSTSSGQTDLVVARDAYESLLAHAALVAPNEACGLLLGDDTRITQARATANIAPDPHRHFEIDPQALIDAHRAERAGGPQLIGYYHSHPTGPAEPSATDRARASGDGRVWAIIAGGEVRCWRDGDDGFAPLSYALVDG